LSKIYNLQNNILQLEFIPAHDYPQEAYQRFLLSKLGGLHQAIPWSELVAAVKGRLSRETRGRKPIFDTRGKLALMFLKSYLDVSDEQLMERLSSDYLVQFFCGVYFRPEDKVPDFKLISQIRVELGKNLDLDAFQKVMAKHWKPYMKDIEEVLSDATCYESDIRYPTDVKLLWECCEWLKKQIDQICKDYRVSKPRSKYKEQSIKQLAYGRRKKPTHKQTQTRSKSLLYLLEKLKGQLETLIQEVPTEDIKTLTLYFSRIYTVGKVYEQQKHKYETGEHPADRIVSLHKDYLRPIVRGKENKRVEFGAKVNMIQIDGVNFIEHFSYDAFHEGNRLISGIKLHEELMSLPCERVAADTIYATNANRKACRSKQITTSFIPKGPQAKDEAERKKARKELARKRATQMEGSFGVEKQHYSLTRIKARSALTEKLWIFFGIHTANAIRMIPKMLKPEQIPIQQAA